MLVNLKKLREISGVTQKQLADEIGVSQQSINKYENHNIEPDIETLIRIADFFNTSVDYLVGHTDIQRKIEAVQEFHLNRDESELVERYRKLSSKRKECVISVVRSY